MSKTWVAVDGIHNDRIVRAGAGLALAVLGVTAWVLCAGSSSGDSKNSGFTHMHCSVCQEEVPYIARLAGNNCPVCASGGTYTPTVGSIKDGAGAPSVGAKLLVYLLVALVALQGLAYLVVLRVKALRKAAAEARNRLMIGRCPYCRRKVGFPAPKAGRPGLCPRCKTAFVLVSLDEDGKL